MVHVPDFWGPLTGIYGGLKVPASRFSASTSTLPAKAPLQQCLREYADEQVYQILMEAAQPSATNRILKQFNTYLQTLRCGYLDAKFVTELAGAGNQPPADHPRGPAEGGLRAISRSSLCQRRPG